MSSDKYLSSKDCLFKSLKEVDTIFRYLHMETELDTISFFEREFKSLHIFLSLLSFVTDESNMLDVTHKVHVLFQNAAVELSEFNTDNSFDLYTSKVRKEICLIKREIRDKYSFPKISLPLQSNKDGVGIFKYVTEFIDDVVERLYVFVKIDEEGSLVCVPKTMSFILEELDMLRNFLKFVSARFIEPQSQHHVVDLFSHVLAVAGHTSVIVWLYLPWRGSMNQEYYLAPREMNVLLSDFLRMKIRPIQPSIRKIYVDVLQTLKSTIQPGCYPNIQIEQLVESEVEFVETIMHNLVELPQDDSNSTQRVALEDHLQILQKMIYFFQPNIIHMSIQGLEFLIRDIDTVIIDVGLLVYSLYEGEEEKVGNAHLLDLSGNIQRISTAVYPIIRKSFQSILPKIHGLGYIDFLLNKSEGVSKPLSRFTRFCHEPTSNNSEGT